MEKKSITEQVVVVAPEPHGVMPEEVGKRWQQTYLSAYEDAKLEPNLDEAGRQQHALKEANRLLRVPKLESFDQAQELKASEPWKIHHESRKDGKLRIVTIDGRKYSFPIPAAKRPAANAGDQKPAANQGA